jgi:DNA-binding transcriptional ArsR family regulator
MDPLSLIFGALANPVRRSILAKLRMGRATVKELAAPYTMSGPAITRHLKVLENAGLIQRSHDAQYRFSEIDATPLATVSSWIEDYREIWKEQLDSLEGYLDKIQNDQKTNNKGDKKQV